MSEHIIQTKHRESNQRYQASKKGRATIKKYRQTRKCKIARSKEQQRYRLRYPKKHKAHWTISSAIERGKILPASSLQCHFCDKNADEYHHNKGYGSENEFDVISVCIKCHKKCHP